MTARPDELVGRQRLALRWLAAGAAVPIVAIASITEADPDLWGHLRFGLDLLSTHRLTAIDPYSFTQDRPWVNHEWLSEGSMALAYSASGIWGLVILKAALIVGAFALVWASLRGVEFSVQLAVLAAVAVGTGPLTKSLRPQLWSLVCFAMLSWVLAHGEGKSRRWLPLIFVVWANAHGGWLLGAGVLALWALLTSAIHRKEAARWAIVAVLCAAATLCTPYGVTLWRFLWSTVGLERDITEWQPLWTEPSIVWLPWGIAAATAVWAARFTDGNRLARTMVLGLLAYLSLRVARIAPFFILGTALLTSPLMPARPVGSGLLLRSRQDLAVAMALAIALAASGVWIAASVSRCIAVDSTRTWVPDTAAARAFSGTESGRLVTLFGWGEYAIWHWGPRLRVSMDGRRETIYSDERVREHDAIRDGRPEGLATLASWRPEYVWLPATSAATHDWLAGHGYRIDARTRRSFLAVRDDLPALAVPNVGPGPSGCFPD